MDGSARRLPVSDSLFGAFDAVADGIADQVGQGFGDHVKRLLSRSVSCPLITRPTSFATLFRDVAHHAGIAAEKAAPRHHADFHDRALQVTEHARLKGHGIAETAAQGFLGNMAGEIR
jgi:hypothetical protein